MPATWAAFSCRLKSDYVEIGRSIERRFKSFGKLRSKGDRREIEPASVDARGGERREIEIYASVKHYKSLL